MNARRSTLAALAVLDAAVLRALAPRWGALIGHVRAPHRWVAADGADRAAAELASAALWLAAAWLAVGLVAMSASALPGAAGRLARRLARIVLPRAVYRLVVGAAGLGVLLTPVAAGAAARDAHAGGSAGSSAPARVTPAPVWPSDDPLPAPSWPTAAPPLTAPTTSRPTTDHTGPSHATASPNAPAPAPTSTAATPTARHPGPTPSAHRPESVVVQRGDSLWSIAAAHERAPSTARTAADWPRWFAANRRAIGTDPDRIVPGQVLHAPTKEDLP